LRRRHSGVVNENLMRVQV